MDHSHLRCFKTLGDGLGAFLVLNKLLYRWYYVNWGSSKIQQTFWLKNAGCDAVMQKCLTVGANPTVVSGSGKSFCTAPNTQMCSYDGSAKGYCSFSTALTIPDTSYQYYSGSNATGGSLAVMDFCPTMRAWGNGHCGGNANIYAEELKVSSSRCFQSTLSPAPNSAYSSAHTACYAVCVVRAMAC